MRFYRIGAAAAVAGGVLGIVANIAHAGPRRGATTLFLADLADSRIWLLDNLAIAVALLLLTGGLAAITRSLRPSPWATYAWTAALIGVGLALVNVAVDGPAMKELADAWDTATGDRREALAAAGEALRQIDVATFTMWSLVLTGAAPLLYGAAMRDAPAYPGWLALVALGAGGLGVASATVQFFLGLTPLTVFWTFPIASGLLLVWVIVTGVLLWRFPPADPAADGAGG